MLFKPELARLIVAGKKTQTRRIVRGESYYRAGRSYPLERIARRDEMSEVEKVRMDRPDPKRRGRPPRIAIGKLDIVTVEAQRLDEMTFAEARAEGFRTPAEFRRYWLALHDRAWPRIERVPCPSCLGDPEMPSDEMPPCTSCGGEAELPFQPWPTDDEVLERFRARHGHVLTWVITFELSRDHAPRYLAEQSELGYVASEYNERGRRVALIGEPEALSEADFAKHIATHEQRAKEEQRRQSRTEAHRHAREMVGREERIRLARAAAGLNGVDISGELALARRHRTAGDLPGELRAIRAAERLAELERRPRAA